MKPLRIEYSLSKKDCPYWAASFPDLLVFAQGKTFGETIENLVDALQLWVEDCMEHGKLRETLKEGGHEDLYDEFMEDTTHIVNDKNNLACFSTEGFFNL